MQWQVLLFVVTVLALPQTEGAVLCYYESWAVYRDGDGKVDIEDLNPSLCTHYIYAYAGIDTDYNIKVLDPWTDLCDDGGKCGYDRFTAMKDHDPYLLTLLGVGGWNDGSALYSEMAATPESRATFITSSIELVKIHKFDGLDLKWEYPTQNGGAPQDRDNFVQLLKEMKEAMAVDGLVLTISVAPTRGIIDVAYDIPGIAEHVDLANVMTYNFHGSWEDYTHHHSGLFPFLNDTDDNLYMNVDAAISYWLDGGMPGNKLVMGVPTYGRCWSLDTEKEHGYYAPANLPGQQGPWTQVDGFMAYAEICVAQQEESWTVAIEVGCNEPYTYHMPSNRIWCSYEDHDSVIIKSLYAAERGLAGVMVSFINDDDAHGSCHERNYELTWTIANTFSSASH